MAGFLNAVSACLVLLLLMSVGYLMGRLGWMTAAEKKFVSKYIINIAVPCNCIVGLLNNLDRNFLAEAGGMMAIGIMSVIITVLVLAIRRNRRRRCCPRSSRYKAWPCVR